MRGSVAKKIKKGVMPERGKEDKMGGGCEKI